jgi:CrcB protein
VTWFVWTAVVAIGGIGSVLRFLVDRTVSGRFSGSFPVGTFAVNISGATLLGFFAGLGLSGDAALLAGTAFVGAYTTFSTWMIETQRLTEERQYAVAAGNIALSLLLGLAAGSVGQWIGGHL